MEKETEKITVETLKEKIEEEKLLRSSRLQAMNDYIVFFVSKLIGISALIAGGVELLIPGRFPIVVKNPLLIMILGIISLLIDKRVISRIYRTFLISRENFNGQEIANHYRDALNASPLNPAIKNKWD